MSRQLRIGVQLWPGGAPDYQSWRSAVIRAEDLGVDIIFGYDHFHAPAASGVTGGLPILTEDQPDVNNFEGWTALATWGEITKRPEIGTLVTGIGYRNPDLLADMARTVDHISGGRLILGLGAGWYEKDYTTYGYDFGTLKSRFDQFDAGLDRIAARLPILKPPPLRKIPILIGGAGPKRALPAVARHADIWHTNLQTIEEFRDATARVDDLAAEAGRDGTAIERSVRWHGAQSAETFRRAGVTIFTTEIHPTDEGYDFSVLTEMLAWRKAQQ
ncbi:LLM class F420-dependent oxidoreductase [Mycolicibacterium goodii]|uniref:LLM class F420-dependent oxidoreductase n=1 Tax=Mycolicibacterium goodii TaxID=134601 RepID=UPI00093C7828|nr:LLM class F420-dependent oxidoreductase [Mycolicibacterium goodii]MBU8807773.1 LLM class F420-dependent oxidoreductase [Mycolicibacterium goodii]OKH64626.1 oxidoreductase [Mycobacterium sp. SWH-M5]ULN51075.1 LLM class F420-dependent oxidoreductase [Mycolicibacterium goodii]